MPIIVRISAPLVAVPLMPWMAKPVVCATSSDDDLYQMGPPILHRALELGREFLN